MTTDHPIDQAIRNRLAFYAEAAQKVNDLYETAARMVEARGLSGHSEVAAAWFRSKIVSHAAHSARIGKPKPERPGEGCYVFFRDTAPCRRQAAVYVYALAGLPDIAIQWIEGRDRFGRSHACSDCNCPLPRPS